MTEIFILKSSSDVDIRSIISDSDTETLDEISGDVRLNMWDRHVV